MNTITLPARYASALINNDISGIEADELEHVIELAAAYRFTGVSEEEFYTRYNGLGDACLEYTYEAG